MCCHVYCSLLRSKSLERSSAAHFTPRPASEVAALGTQPALPSSLNLLNNMHHFSWFNIQPYKLLFFRRKFIAPLARRWRFSSEKQQTKTLFHIYFKVVVSIHVSQRGVRRTPKVFSRAKALLLGLPKQTWLLPNSKLLTFYFKYLSCNYLIILIFLLYKTLSLW